MAPEWMNWPIWNLVGEVIQSLTFFGFGAYAVGRLQKQIWDVERRLLDLDVRTHGDGR